MPDKQVIWSDTRQQKGKHTIKEQWWLAHCVSIERKTLKTGDYQTPNSNVTIDTKKGLEEIAANIGGKNHTRFRNECKRAQSEGYRLVILIETNDCITCISDVSKWINTHCFYCQLYKVSKCNPRELSTRCIKHNKRKPIQGEQLAKAMLTMGEKYGVVFRFCKPENAARIICDLLGVTYER